MKKLRIRICGNYYYDPIYGWSRIKSLDMECLEQRRLADFANQAKSKKK